MEVATPSLLHDWKLLQERLMPPLLDGDTHRRPVAWSIGSAKDAIAVAVAFEYATRKDPGLQLDVFLSGCDSEPGLVRFVSSDLRSLPAGSKSDWFQHRDRRWVPQSRFVERVILGLPPEPVDVMTVRGRDTPPCAGTPFDRLRAGGHVMFVDDPPQRFQGDPDFRAVGRTGRVFRKLSPASTENFESEWDADARQTLADRQAQSALVESHVGLARSLARRFTHHGETPEDLEQVALLALVKAARRFDPERGFTFAAFAAASILGELKRHFRDKTWMLRVPRSLQETYLSVKDAREELGHKLGCSPTVQQIAQHLGVSDEAVLDAMEAGDSYWPASLDTPRTEEESVTEVPVVDPGFDQSLDRRQLRDSLPRLTDREQLIVKRLYFDGWTQRRVADEIGVSQMQVSRLMLRTLHKLRSWLEED
jgi:RNA polymerase sigma-B factor